MTASAHPSEASETLAEEKKGEHGENLPATSDGADSPMWYVQLNGETRGPYTSSQIGAMLKQGSILPHTPVAKAGASSWSPAAHEFAQDTTILTLVADGPAPPGGRDFIPPGIILAGTGAVLFPSAIFFCYDFGTGTDSAYINEDKQCMVGFAIAGGVLLLGGATLILTGVSRNIKRRRWLRKQLFPGTFQMGITRNSSGLFWHITF